MPKRSNASEPFDREWWRRHLEELLGLWLRYSPSDNGFLRCSPDRQWKSKGKELATLVSQSRLIFNFAVGAKLGQEGHISVPVGELRKAGSKGLEFLIRHFRDGENGGWVWSVDTDGNLLEDHKDTYGHAFVLLALAWGGRYLADDALRGEAASLAGWTWQVMQDKLTDGKGGFRRYMDRLFREDRDEVRSQNPLMHLFEALMAQRDLMAAGWARKGAAALREFVLGNLFEPVVGCLPENYGKDWRPLTPSEKGRIDLGHQFEWAFLLTEYEPHEAVPPEAGMLARFGLISGLDNESGGVRSNYGSDEFEPYVWWTQAEALRALVRLRRRAKERSRLGKTIGALSRFIVENFVDKEYGGWYGSVRGDGTPLGYNKGSPWKVDYHVVGMCSELLAP